MNNRTALSPGKIIWKKLSGNILAMTGFSVLASLALLSIAAPLLTQYDPNLIDMFNIESAPSAAHILGTDDLGRDVFSRLLYGARVSLFVGVCATGVQLVIGVSLGAIAGYYGGIVDSAIMRITDIVMCFPFYSIAITMAALLGANIWNVVIIIGVLNWTGISRIVRAEVLSLKQREFIEAARAIALNHFEIITRHIIPNALGPIVVYATLGIATGVLSEASLSFLGLGVKPPQPSWGNMLSAAQSMRVLSNEWWLWVPPGLMVFLTVLSINFLGDGLRDAIDPNSKL